MPTLAIALIVVVIAAVGWRLLSGTRGGARWEVRVRGTGAEGVVIKGNVPGHAAADVQAFVAELELPDGSRFWGYPDGDEVRIGFSEGFPVPLDQRIRNFVRMKVR